MRLNGSRYVMETSFECPADYVNRAALVNDLRIEVDGLPTTKMALIYANTSEFAGSGAAQALPFGASTIVEFWNKGEVIESALVDVPADPSNVALDDYFGYAFVDASGNALPRTGYQQQIDCPNSWGYAYYAYTGGTPPGLAVSASSSIAGSGITPAHYGHYQMQTPSGPLDMRIYAGGAQPVVFFWWQGQRMRATYRAQRPSNLWSFVAGADAKAWESGVRPQFVYVPQNGSNPTVIAHPGLAGSNFTLSGLNRID